LTLFSLVAAACSCLACASSTRRINQVIFVLLGSGVGGSVILQTLPLDASSLSVIGMYCIAPALIATSLVVVFTRTRSEVLPESSSA
jgi:hypothetical protein